MNRRDALLAQLVRSPAHCPFVLAALPDWTLERIADASRASEPDQGADSGEVLRFLLSIGAAYQLPGESDGHHVYRIAFDDGAAYVGITGRMVINRIKEHFGATGPHGEPKYYDMPIADRIEHGIGTFNIVERLAAGIPCRVEILASGLTKDDARALEGSEIAKLEKPLNATGPTRAWTDPLAPDPRHGAVARWHKEHGNPRAATAIRQIARRVLRDSNRSDTEGNES